MEKKLAQDGRRAEAEILIQEMLDAFRSKLEQEYADKIKGERPGRALRVVDTSTALQKHGVCVSYQFTNLWVFLGTEKTIVLREEAHGAAWDRLFDELEKRKR